MTELVMLLEPRDARWELPVRGSERIATGLIGWRDPVGAVDAGVPAAVGAIAGQALVRLGRVIYLVDDDPEAPLGGPWTARAGAVRRRVGPRGLRRLHRVPLALEATDDPARAAGLFDTGRHAWHLRSQLAMACERASPLPPLSLAWIERTLGRRDAELEALPAGAAALLLPAVDGDFIQLVALAGAPWDAARRAWAAAARDAGAEWAELAEPGAFAARCRRDPA